MNGGCAGCVSFDVLPYTAAFAGLGGRVDGTPVTMANPLLLFAGWGTGSAVPGGGWGGGTKASDVIDVDSSGDPLARPAEKLPALWPKLLALVVGAAVGLTAAKFLSRHRR